MDLLIFGYFATFFSAVSFLPQAIKTIKTRDVSGLSLLTYVCLFLASLSWFTYGVVLNDIPLMATYYLATFFQSFILFYVKFISNKGIALCGYMGGTFLRYII